METLQDLARRLQSVRDLHSVVRTMKALAAVNIGQFERTAQSVDEYAKTVRLGLMALLRNPRTPLSVRPGPTGPLGGIVFGSDQGMCGRLNEELARMTCTALEKESQRRITLLAVGERVAGSLEDAGFPPTDVYRVPSGTGGIPALVQTLVVDIQHWTQTHGLQEVRLFHPRQEGPASSRPVQVRLLPLDRHWLKSLGSQPWPGPSIPMCPRDLSLALSRLVEEYLFSILFRAQAQALASENAMRLAAMQAAEKNIQDTLHNLTREYNSSRQAAITEEILDIAGGFNALA